MAFGTDIRPILWSSPDSVASCTSSLSWSSSVSCCGTPFADPRCWRSGHAGGRAFDVSSGRRPRGSSRLGTCKHTHSLWSIFGTFAAENGIDLSYNWPHTCTCSFLRCPCWWWPWRYRWLRSCTCVNRPCKGWPAPLGRPKSREFRNEIGSGFIYSAVFWRKFTQVLNVILRYEHLKVFVFEHKKPPFKWLLDAQTWISKLERIHRRFLTRHEVPYSASGGLKKMR